MLLCQEESMTGHLHGINSEMDKSSRWVNITVHVYTGNFRFHLCFTTTAIQIIAIYPRSQWQYLMYLYIFFLNLKKQKLIVPLYLVQLK